MQKEELFSASMKRWFCLAIGTSLADIKLKILPVSQGEEMRERRITMVIFNQSHAASVLASQILNLAAVAGIWAPDPARDPAAADPRFWNGLLYRIFYPPATAGAKDAISFPD